MAAADAELTGTDSVPYEWHSDPAAGVDANGTFYYATMLIQRSRRISIAVSRSDDGGDTWTRPVTVSDTDGVTVTDDKEAGMPSFNNDAGGVYRNIALANGAELDVDWFTDLVMFTGGGRAGGATAYAYALGKGVWSAGNRGQSGYPFPFQDPGERTALSYVAQGFRFVDDST